MPAGARRLRMQMRPWGRTNHQQEGQCIRTCHRRSRRLASTIYTASPARTGSPSRPAAVGFASALVCSTPCGPRRPPRRARWTSRPSPWAKEEDVVLMQETTSRDIEAERAAIDLVVNGKTLCSELARTAARHADLDAMKWKVDGAWRSLTFRAYRERVREAALGLRVLGLEPRGFGLVLTGNRHEHVIASQAMLHVQSTPVGVYEAIAASQLAYIANHCEATVAVVDADRLDMVLELRSQLPHIRHVVVCGAAGEPDPGGWVICWDELLALGRAEHQRDPFAFETSALGVAADDVATIIYTSGTTGPPKGVVLTHRFVLCWVEAMNMRERVVPGDRVVSYLPLAHCTSQWLTQWQSTVCAT